MKLYSPHETTFHNLIKFQHMLTPIAIDWFQLANANPMRAGRQYRTLYIFGFRVATWRCD